MRGRYWRVGFVVSVVDDVDGSVDGWPDGERSCEDIAGRASERGFGSRVGDGGGESEEVVV